MPANRWSALSSWVDQGFAYIWFFPALFGVVFTAVGLISKWDRAIAAFIVCWLAFIGVLFIINGEQRVRRVTLGSAKAIGWDARDCTVSTERVLKLGSYCRQDPTAVRAKYHAR